MKISITLLAVALCIPGVGGNVMSGGDVVEAVRSFDLSRYMGTWCEIARYDHRFERGLVDVKASYRLLSDHRIEVENSGMDYRTGVHHVARGQAYATQEPGRLRVSFFWFFYSDYKVLALGDNYDWALVGSRSPKYLWILSRTPSLPCATLNRILRLAKRHGYNTDKLLFIDQHAEC